jgi:tetratricopeptide (TPR) repeat protein
VRVNLANAITINNRPEYYLSLARVSLTQAQVEAQAAQAPLDTETRGRVQGLLSDAVNYSKIALDAKPYSVAMWENRAMIFESVSSFADQARDFAIQSLQEAVKLEPTNAALWYRLGENQRLQWIEKKASDDPKKKTAQSDEERVSITLSLKEETQTHLQKAIELKPDYYAPRLSLSRIAEDNDDFDTAINIMQEGLQYSANQNNAAVYYEIARLMYNQLLKDRDSDNKEKLTEIARVLDQSISISPNYSNALYTRALVLRQLGQYERAKKDMELVVQLNPDDKDVQAQMDALNNRSSQPVEVPLPLFKFPESESKEESGVNTNAEQGENLQ